MHKFHSRSAANYLSAILEERQEKNTKVPGSQVGRAVPSRFPSRMLRDARGTNGGLRKMLRANAEPGLVKSLGCAKIIVVSQPGFSYNADAAKVKRQCFDKAQDETFSFAARSN